MPALRRAGRAALLLALVMVGTVMLVRLAPGYLADAAELDSQRGAVAQAEVTAREHEETLPALLAGTARAWARGDLRTSRQYGEPVSALLAPRAKETAGLLVRGVGLGWALALGAAVAATAGRRMRWLGLPFSVLLAVPTGAMAAVCLRAEMGGPVAVLTLLVAARDFRFLERVLTEAMQAPYLLQARAQGLGWAARLRVHVLPAVGPQMRALLVMSAVTALSALVPVEVLFDRPGLAQAAWNAAVNRDLPVLLAVTMMMAATVACLSVVSDAGDAAEAA